MCAERSKRANDRIRITALLLCLVLVGALMGACSKKDENNPSGSNNNPPTALQVSSMTPTHGATGVSQTAPVSVTFNRMVDPTTVTTASLYIDGVSGTASANGATATFTPNAPLAENTQYMLVVLSTITDTAGVALSADTSISFTTGVRPSASAGNDREAAFNASVTLNGSSNIVGGIYQWNQLSGPSVGSLNGQAPAFTAPTVATTLIFELIVSDGSATSDPDTVKVFIVESGAGGIWVSESGSDASSGTRNDPVQTITKAVELASASAKDVYVAAGVFNESIELADNVSIYGGYNSADWTRDYVMNITTINGGATAMRAVNAQNVVLEGLDIHAADATSPSESSVGVSLSDSRGAKIMHCSITAGNGAKGNDASQPGKPGKADGGNTGTGAGGCSPANGGGSGGSGSGRAGGKGGTGGAAGGFDGGGGEGPCGGGGSGGFASAGSRGTDGCTGGDGADESVPGPSFGSVVNGVYQAASGYFGSNGASGGGGGGGGGGAGSLFGCGAGGGGGGAGGIGGSGGSGGAGGGGSFGIIASANSDVQISDVTITLGIGGDGGSGAVGGAGGDGGSGGSGGGSATAGWSGGRGGNGGTGGTGGDGSGGGGGPCIAIVEQGSSSVQSNITFNLGQPGQGGGSSPSSVAGETGEQAEVKKLP